VLKKISISNEIKYYIRDFYIFIFCSITAIILAESIIFSGTNDVDLVERIFGYIYFIIPFFTLSLIISYLYRNIRNKQTGKIRSVIRYRLTVAFIFVSILPSIPIFILSSNVVSRLVESFYRIDISKALIASKNTILYEESGSRIILKNKADEIFKSTTLKKKLNNEFFYSNLIKNNIINDQFYFSIISNDILIYENFYLFKRINKEKYILNPDEEYYSQNIYFEDKAFIIFKIENNNESNIKDYYIIGKQIHVGNEPNIFTIINTENSYNTAQLWKEKVPFALRLSLGLFSIGMFAVSIVVSFFLARQLSRPIVELARATQRVSKGDTDFVLENKEEGEMGILIESFNQMTKDLKSKKEELLHIQRVAAWKEVAQRMAHEIKNPLTPIQLSAERIKRKLDSPNKEKLEEIIRTGTETIIGQVRVLEHLVKEFSEFARMPSPVLINQNINPIIEESINLFNDSDNIKFTLRLSKNLPEVFIDKRLFLGVINNLIKNAIEAIMIERSESGKARAGLIKISTKHDKKFLRKSVIVLIEDNGPGLPEKFKDKIFEPYFSTKEAHGTGIGLTIVQKTVYDHGGQISVENSELGGCRFKIELPTQE
jgi:two-component system, NtrC family, nitrogen regulation sensor histidine kinase NtrY